MEYYYLEEKEQKGPVSIEQLKTIGVKANTLVWREGLSEWTPACEIEELSLFFQKKFPPLPFDSALFNNKTIANNSDDLKDISLEYRNVRFGIAAKIYIIIAASFVLVFLTSHQIVSIKRKNLRQEIHYRIDKILGGKPSALDGTFEAPGGSFWETGFPDAEKKESGLSDSKKWGLSENLYTIFIHHFGGFNVSQLTKKDDDSYSYSRYKPWHMGYKKPLQSYVEHKQTSSESEWNFGGGYYVSNERQSVKECYLEVFNSLTKENLKSPGAYSPGKYLEIEGFHLISNEYFRVDNNSHVERTTRRYANSDWIIEYLITNSDYYVIEKKDKSRSDFYKYIGIFSGLVILVLVILLFAKPRFFRNLHLYGKPWVNVSTPEQVLFFEHSFFKPNSFIEIIQDKSYKGVLKFMNRERTIILSYAGKDLFYRIENIDENNLQLVSAKDKSQVIFKRKVK